MVQRRDTQEKQIQELVGSKTMPKAESLALSSKAPESWGWGLGQKKKEPSRERPHLERTRKGYLREVRPYSESFRKTTKGSPEASREMEKASLAHS